MPYHLPKGRKLGDAKILSIATQAAKSQFTKLTVDSNLGYALFLQEAKNEYHLILTCYDAIDENNPEDSNAKPLLVTTKIRCVDNEIKNYFKSGELPEGAKIHAHYLICQNAKAKHFVYGYVNPEGFLVIKDSFPWYLPNSDKETIIKHIPKFSDDSFCYENTGDQYNSTDCGHYTLQFFKQQIGLLPAPSFFETHHRKIGFCIGVLITGLALASALMLTGGLSALTLPFMGYIIGILAAGGTTGAIFANAFDTRLFEQRGDNAFLLEAYDLEEAKHTLKPKKDQASSILLEF